MLQLVNRPEIKKADATEASKAKAQATKPATVDLQAQLKQIKLSGISATFGGISA